jgi:peptidoglycan hydrolase CwlO-like protein
MNFNDSFGEIEPKNDKEKDKENNINIISIEKGDIGDIEDESKKNNEYNKEILNTSFSNNNNIFSSLPLEMEIDNEYAYSNDIYDTLLSKELLKYNISNLFNILKSKIIIIKSQIFYHLKKTSNKKFKYLIQSEVLFLRMSSSIQMLSNIFKKNRANKLYQVFYILLMKNKNINDKFKLQYENKFKKEKDRLVNEKNNTLKNLDAEIKDIEKKIISLNKKENEAKIEINNLTKKEKQLKDQIKQLENSINNAMRKSVDLTKQQSSNISSINNNSKYDSDIISLESTIETSKQLKEGKEEIIKKFIYKMNELLNEYQVYIDKLNENVRNNNINLEINDNSNHQSLTHKDKDGSGNTWYSSKTNFGNQQSGNQQNNNNNEQGK